jgi:hypothetical protein
MDTFAPEFSKFWLVDAKASQAEASRAGGDDDARQMAALEELADLVSAARSIV